MKDTEKQGFVRFI